MSTPPLLRGWPHHQQLDLMTGCYQVGRTNICRTCLVTCSYMIDEFRTSRAQDRRNSRPE